MSWVIKKAEHWRIDAFELWCWRILFRVPQTAKKVKLVTLKGNQPWIFFGRINVEVEAPILWPPDEKSWLIRKDLDAGKDWRQRRRESQRMRSLDGISNSMDMNLSKLQGIVKQVSPACCSPWGVAKSQTGLTYWLNNSNWENMGFKKIHNLPVVTQEGKDIRFECKILWLQKLTSPAITFSPFVKLFYASGIFKGQ